MERVKQYPASCYFCSATLSLGYEYIKIPDRKTKKKQYFIYCDNFYCKRKYRITEGVRVCKK